MIKFKRIILFCVIIFLILIASFLSWKFLINKIGSTYYPASFEETDKEAEYCIIDNQKDFAILLRDIVPEKYTNDYFLENFVVVFKTIESKQNRKPVISSYNIKNNTLTIRVKSKYAKEKTTKAGWVVLELPKEIECSFDNVKIIKNYKVLDSVDVKQKEVIDVKKDLENRGRGTIITYICKIDKLYFVIYSNFVSGGIPFEYTKIAGCKFEHVPYPIPISVVNEDDDMYLLNAYYEEWIDDDDVKILYENFRKYYKEGETN